MPEVMFEIGLSNSPAPSDNLSMETRVQAKLSFLPEWARVLLEATLLPLLFVLPALSVYIFMDFPIYGLSDKVDGIHGINLPMEFLRWSVFISTSYSVFVLTQYLTKIIPFIISWLLTTLDVKISETVEFLIGLLTGLRFYFGVIFCSIILSRICVLLFNYEASNDDAKGSYQAQVFATLGAILMIAIFFLVKEAGVIAIGSNFRKKHFYAKIHDSNFRTFVIKTLDRAANHVSIGKANLLQIIGSPISSDIINTVYGMELTEDKVGLTSHTAAYAIGKKIFAGLKTHDTRDFLTVDDFRAYFDNKDYMAAFSIFAYPNGTPDDEESISDCQMGQKQFLEGIIAAYNLRNNLERSLIDHGRVLSKVNTMLTILVVIGIGLFVLPQYSPSAKSYFLTLITIIAGAAFLFSSTIQDLYSIAMYVFIIHPYDIGDVVTINGTEYTVTKIGLFSSLFLKKDGTITLMTNLSLCGGTVLNTQRSFLSPEIMKIAVAPQTTFTQVKKLRDGISGFLTREGKDFGKITDTFGFKVLEGSTKVLIEFKTTHVTGPEKTFLRFTRRPEFITAVENIARAANISYEIFN